MTDLDKVLEAMERDLKIHPDLVEPLSIQAWNSHYRLEFEGGVHHLVIYRLPDPEAINGLLFEHKILRFLVSSGFELVPKVLVVNKESLFRFDGGWFAITEWIPNCRKEDDPPLTTGQIRNMAKGLADLHRVLAHADMTLDYHPDHVFVYPLPAFMGQRAELLSRLEARLGGPGFDDEARAGWASVGSELRAFLERFPLGTYWEVVTQVGARVVHGDFRGMNAAFDGDELTHILDFNCCFNELRLWDVAYTALGLGGKETIGALTDYRRPAQFLRAYHERSPLTEGELRLLPDMLTFVVAKLMVGAVEGWWITDRVDMFKDLKNSGAQAIVREAGLEVRT